MFDVGCRQRRAEVASCSVVHEIRKISVVVSLVVGALAPIGHGPAFRTGEAKLKHGVISQIDAPAGVEITKE